MLSAKEAKKKADEEARLAAEEAARLKRLDDRARTEHAWQSLENIIAQATERVRQVLDGHGLRLDRGSQFYLEGGRYGSELHLKEVGKEVGTVRMWLETTSDPFKLVVGSEALNFEKITVDDLSDALSRAF